MIPITVRQAAHLLGGRLAGGLGTEVVTGISTDSRAAERGGLFFAIPGERFDGHDFVEAAFDSGSVCSVVSRRFRAPTHHGQFVYVDDVVRSLGKLAAWNRQQLGATVIAVTGSNGKTTTKNMLAHILGSRYRCRCSKNSYNNNIGVPLTLLSADRQDEYLVVEIGSNFPGEVGQLAEMVEPDAGMLTNVGHAHLQGFRSLDGVRAEKLSLFEHVRTNGLAIADRGAVAALSDLPRRDVLRWATFGEHADADFHLAEVTGGLECTSSLINGLIRVELRVPGIHNAGNAAGVYAMCHGLGLSDDDVLTALRSFEMPEHRLCVERIGSITIIDDTYNANPNSMKAAIRTISMVPRESGRRILVVGEMAELGEASERLHRDVGEESSRAGLDVVVAIGESARPVTRRLSWSEGANNSTSPQFVFWATVAEACEKLPSILRRGDTVLMKGSRVAGLDVLPSTLREHARLLTV